MNRLSSTFPRSSVLRVGHLELEIKNNLVTVCAWCNRVRDTDNTWHPCDVNELYNAGLKSTHTICPDCKTECLNEMSSPYPTAAKLNFSLA